MWQYTVRRLFFFFIVLFGVTVIAFVLTHLVPADPVIAVLGEHARPEQVKELRERWALDEPLYVQYWIYLTDLVQGDLGTSIRTRNEVLDDLSHYWPATVELSTAAILWAIFLGIPVGILAAVYRDTIWDHVTRVFALTGSSVPVFWLALILILFLYYHVSLFPATGRLDPFLRPPPRLTGLFVIDSLLTGNLPALINSLWHLVLPAFCLGYLRAGLIMRITRSSMLEVLREDYITTARAKGLSERVVIYKHALRNAIIPTVTIIGMGYGSLLSGAVLTESIFSWPGLGRYATNSMLNVDVPAVMGVTLTMALIYSIANLIVDLSYAFINPQITYD